MSTYIRRMYFFFDFRISLRHESAEVGFINHQEYAELYINRAPPAVSCVARSRRIRDIRTTLPAYRDYIRSEKLVSLRVRERERCDRVEWFNAHIYYETSPFCGRELRDAVATHVSAVTRKNLQMDRRMLVVNYDIFLVSMLL